MATRKELLDFLYQSLLSSSTGCLEVNSPKQSGKLYLEFGQLVHAECPAFLGEEALWALLRIETSELNFEANIRPKNKTISRPSELILMESAVHVDQPDKIGIKAKVESEEEDPPNYFRITTSVHFEGDDDEKGRKLYILSAGDSILGRSNSCDLIIGDKTVSRQHAVITVSGKDVTLRDLGGRNGTRLNQRQINEATLNSNDTINIGMVILRFFWSNNGEPVLVQDPLKSPTNTSPTGMIHHPPQRV
ncbi:MAG: FHA domain-containing protein [Verrucomicrobiota bacterium]